MDMGTMSRRRRRGRGAGSLAFAVGIVAGPLARYSIGGASIDAGYVLILLGCLLVGSWSLLRSTHHLARNPALFLALVYMLFVPVIALIFYPEARVYQQLGLLVVPVGWLLAFGAGFQLEGSGSSRSVMRGLVGGLVVVNLVFVVVQTFSSVRNLGPLGELWAWDVRTKIELGGLGFGRATGAFANANQVSAIGLLGLAVGMSFPRLRYGLSLTLGGTALLLSGESRSYLFAGLALVALHLRRSRLSPGSTRASVGLFIAAVVMVVSGANERLTSLIQLGASESSISGRLNQARSVENLSGSWWLVGDGRPPGSVVGGSVDSDWLYMALLYGVPLALTLFVGLFWLIRSVARRGHGWSSMLVPLSVSIAVASIAQLPLLSVPGTILWYSAGVAVKRCAVPRRSGNVSTTSFVARERVGRRVVARGDP